MTKALAVARRELLSYFVSLIPYLVVAGFQFLIALVFFLRSAAPGAEASLRLMFFVMSIAMIPAISLLTMGLISKELDTGTVETMMTTPITEVELILGKFLAMMGFYVVILATTLVFAALILTFGQPDLGVLLTGYLGMTLLGAAYVSVGLFASTLTRYQLLSALVSMVILSVMGFLSLVVSLLQIEVQHIAKVTGYPHIVNFSRGTFDTRGLVYFLSVTALFLFLSVRTLESKRWK
jgi:ABC-2 type transport system permease protein